MTDLTDRALADWRKQDSVSAPQAAYLLAGVVPVKNPAPSISGRVWVCYRLILNAVRRGELPTVGPVRFGDEKDVTYLDYTDPVDWHKYHRQWVNLNLASDIDPDAERDTYRFEIDPKILFTWWKSNAQRNIETNVDTWPVPNDAFYVAALRLAWAGGAPNLTKAALNRELQASGITGLPSEKTLRKPFNRAKEGGDINYPDSVAGPAKEPIKALFIYAASKHDKTLEKASPVQIHHELVELLAEHKIPAPKDNLPWEAIDLL